MHRPPPGSPFGVDPAAAFDEYERQRMDRWSDAHLAERVGSVLGVPLASESPANSFVLHAPLELLARLALLPRVTPEARPLARVRLVSLAAGYARSGERLPPSVGAASTDASGDADRLVAAVVGGDLAEVDRVAPRLAAVAAHPTITGRLANHVLTSLAAAGHANIYLYLAGTSPVGPLGPTLLWPMIREVAKSPSRAMASCAPMPHSGSGEPGAIAEALAQLPVVGPGDEGGIAPMVERAEATGAVGSFLERSANSIRANPEGAAAELLRCAALMMLQGPVEHVPYGWTHCLTLAQAAYAQGGQVLDPCDAVAVAAEYVVAHWACRGAGSFDPTWQPARVEVGAIEALDVQPDAASAAIWFAPEAELGDIEQELATRASAAHDAHHVKYTLSCLRAAAADPPARRLFLAAAATLYAWWETHPNAHDPLADQRHPRHQVGQ